MPLNTPASDAEAIALLLEEYGGFRGRRKVVNLPFLAVLKLSRQGEVSDRTSYPASAIAPSV